MTKNIKFHLILPRTHIFLLVHNCSSFLMRVYKKLIIDLQRIFSRVICSLIKKYDFKIY